MPDPYSDESGITVGQLIERLKGFPSDAPVCFGSHGHFMFNRIKDRGNIAHIEFNEALDIDYVLLPKHHYMEHLKKIGILK